MYKLNKPYTEKERIEFVFNYQLLNIQETDLALYALEPWEKLVDDEVIDNTEQYNEEQVEQKKQEKIEENNKNRDEKLNGGVTYQNVLFDSDTDQKANIIGTVLAMSDTDTVVWYGMDNKGLLCTKNDLMAIGQLITKLHSFCWNNNAYIKEQIEGAQTIEELDNIEISYDRTDT